ncbi:MAG: hypothetical protein ACI90V_012052 [Bacillariaceae sp.]|jgi:hypothetical protein
MNHKSDTDTDTNNNADGDWCENFSFHEDEEDTADDDNDNDDDDDDDVHEEEEFISPASSSLLLEKSQVELQQQPALFSPSPPSSTSDGGIGNVYLEMPAQLHPACSQGIRRVSSCYFPLGSTVNHESMVDLLSQLGDNNKTTSSNINCSSYDTFKNENKNNRKDIDGENESNNNSNNNSNANTHYWPIDNYNNSVDDIFSHDIMMQVFTYLDAYSLRCFSETARRCNYETFYFLQLQLQQALLVENNINDDDDNSSNKMKNDNDNNNNNMNRSQNNYSNNTNTNTPLQGMESQTGYNQHSLSTTIEDSASILSRVAKQDMVKAKEIVQQYQDSNSTLRQMPLSYSLAYVRHYILHNGFHNMFSNNNSSDVNNNSNSTMTSPSSQTLASAAIFMTVVGAASLAASSDAAVITDELPNVLFRVGFVGSLVKAARKISDTERGMAVRERAEQMARSMTELPAALMTTTTTTREEDEQHHQELQQSSQRTQPLHQQSDEVNKETQPRSQSQSHPQQRTKLPSIFEMRQMLQEMMSNLAAKQERQPILFDPYDHLPSSKDKDNNNDAGTSSKEGGKEEKKECDGDDQEVSTPQTITATNMNTSVDRKMPSGCVGAYSRAIHDAANHTTKQIKESRISKFQALSTEDQRERSVEFLAACTSNDSLDRVKEMISIMDVNRFFVGNDGTETCALHTSSFNGADKVVDFLCMGIHHQNSQLDGGLCDINSRDTNGWTALHFAAGANSVPVVRVLARHGATLNVEAQNGYSPLQWAVRLSNEQVAEELRTLLIRVGTDHSMWISSQPLASIANRFFSLIPTQ